MAQLRDRHTSELLAEGQPEELALAAERIGRARVIFDDVGEAFDVDAVLAAHRDRLEGLARAVTETEAQADDPDSDVDQDDVERIRDALAQAHAIEDDVAPRIAERAEQEIEDAHQRVRDAGGHIED